MQTEALVLSNVVNYANWSLQIRSLIIAFLKLINYAKMLLDQVKLVKFHLKIAETVNFKTEQIWFDHVLFVTSSSM